jgi:DNA-binding protein HU-beta
MNKGELVETVASSLGESKAVATRAVEAVLAGLVEGVRKDEKVAIAGFGTFKRKMRKERRAINPATKEPMLIPASYTVGFTPSQALKDSLQDQETLQAT